MKKLFTLALLAITAIGVSAQMQQAMQPLPLDPAVRMGKLENGLTYYIRHNEWPEQRADFYIAQKVGSMQEDDNQRGLAHFLEHMCFNGTKHFPGDKLKSYLETIGVKFGENLNAYTSFDETVYNINNVPVISNPASLDSCLLILHDWSHDLLLEGKEIDKERGVINEEWRMRRSAMQRMQEDMFPKVYEGSKYADRMPIGTMDIVMNFPYDDLRNYYKKWYRPDLQAIVVVGDVDVDAVEAKIKAMFADIAPAPADAAVREYYPVADNKEPIIAIEQDKEYPQSIIEVLWKQDAIPSEMKNTMTYAIMGYMFNAINSMWMTRLDEITQKANPPFIGAQASIYEDYLVSKTKGASLIAAVFKNGGHKEALAAVYREFLRANKFGFTQSEYMRFQDEYKSRLDDMYERRDKISNESFVNEYVRHFLDNVYAPGIEWEHQNMKLICDQIPLAGINQLVMQPLEGAPVIISLMPDKEDIIYPTSEELLDVMKQVEGEELEPYKEEVSDEPIVDASKLKGSKVKKQENGVFDSQKLTLKNGIEIYVKKTDYTPNNIMMKAQSWGGNSLYDDSEYLQTSNARQISLGGWGNFSAIDMGKKLSGIQASATPYISTRAEGISGNCVTKDLETLLQLIYLEFTSPRKDAEVFASTMQRTKDQLQNAEMQPTTALQDTIAKVLYNNHPRAIRTKAEDIDKLNYDRMLEIYKERFADGNDFTFFFVGDIDLETAKPLFEKYIGSIPVLKSKEKDKVIDFNIAKGNRTNVFEKEQETPNALVIFVHQAEMEDNLKNSVQVDALKQILQIMLTETVREDEGGAYSVGVGSNLTDYPENRALIEIQLPTAPEKRAKMTEVINNALNKLVEEGPRDADLQKVKEYMLRSFDEGVKTNGHWLVTLVDKVTENKDYHTGYTDVVNALTAADIQNVARTIFRSGNRIEVGMTTPVK